MRRWFRWAIDERLLVLPPRRIPVLGLALLALGACDRAVAPRRNRLTELRQEATKGVGVFYGRVRAFDSTQSCWNAPRVVAGIRVEVGLWEGSPAFYRDTVTHAPPTNPNDPRFQPIATTTTDGEGRFTFLEMPRGIPYAMRAIPSRDSPWRVTYGETMYGPPNGKDLQDFPILCVKPR
jgi:hypothetical protein